MNPEEPPSRKVYKQPDLLDAWAAAESLPPHEQRALAVFVDLFVRQAKKRNHWSPDDWAALRLIRLVFLVDWDPIGVFEQPGADDEYDDYVPGFYELLRNGASEAELGEYLRVIEDERMGSSQKEPYLSRRALQRQEVVRKIRRAVNDPS